MPGTWRFKAEAREGGECDIDPWIVELAGYVSETSLPISNTRILHLYVVFSNYDALINKKMKASLREKQLWIKD
jgi:hypothetical protein